LNTECQARGTLILALGNPILSDDAVGWEIADRLGAHLPAEGFDILKESGATLDLLRRVSGYERLVVIDAVQLGTAPVGTIHRFTLDDLRPTVRHSSAHDINFATALTIGEQLGYAMPTSTRIYGIEVQELRRFHEGCSPKIAARLADMAAEIGEELAGGA